MSNIQKRHQARCYAMQAIYQWSYDEKTPDTLITEFVEEHDARDFDFAYFQTLVKGAIENNEFIDELMTPHLDRDIRQLNPVELAILRLAIYELMHCKEVPYKVIINEALKLAKAYGAEEGYKYVNAILDALAPQVRKEEVRR